jgi:cytoskeletal protein CcmA (bactofilin family)
MFGKPNDQASPVGATATKTRSKSVLASDLHIKGEVSSTGTVEISGEIQGNVTSKTVVIGAGGRVEGSIAADNVDLQGTFDGTIAAQGLTLRSSCDVKAEICYATLAIETGAIVDGTFKRNQA